MKFGIRLPTFAMGSRTATLDQMADYLRRAEELGFEAAFTMDHLLIPPPFYNCTWLEPISLLSAWAGVTRNMQLGIAIMVLPLRNPVLFAKEWATLDFLSNGRTILGVGVGWHENEFAVMGVPRTERGARTTEALEVLDLLWNNDNVTFHGRYYQFEDVTIEPKPIQRPRPPIWLAGGTSKTELTFKQPVGNQEAVMRRIAKFADVWQPPAHSSPEHVKKDREMLLKLLEEEGRSEDSLRNAYSSFIHVLKPGERPEVAARDFATFSGMDMNFWRNDYLLGEATEVVERILARIEAAGGVDWVVPSPVTWDIEQLELLASEVCAPVREATR